MNIYAHNNIFLNNKYTTWYYRIINCIILLGRTKHTKNNVNYVYYERHHILPRAIFPEYANMNKSKDNIVLLTAREHYVVHLLLTKMTSGPNRYKMGRALYMFKGRNTITPDSIKMNSRHHQKIIDSLDLKHSEETKKRISKTNTGKKRSEETKRKMSEDRSGANNKMRGRPLSKDHKEKISKSKSGERNGMFGKTMSEDVRRKISNTMSHGLYITPWGAFNSTRVAASHPDSLYTRNTILLKCNAEVEGYRFIPTSS